MRQAGRRRGPGRMGAALGGELARQRLKLAPQAVQGALALRAHAV